MDVFLLRIDQTSSHPCNHFLVPRCNHDLPLNSSRARWSSFWGSWSSWHRDHVEHKNSMCIVDRLSVNSRSCVVWMDSFMCVSISRLKRKCSFVVGLFSPTLIFWSWWFIPGFGQTTSNYELSERCGCCEWFPFWRNGKAHWWSIRCSSRLNWQPLSSSSSLRLLVVSGRQTFPTGCGIGWLDVLLHLDNMDSHGPH